ncbi:MAG TPA: D-glycero-beta-D-manno-heptose 1-phosphate adenylyltransferase [Candidatus Hydrogenedens sp.]|nr:D-glycero-beta-D-manno-heptose 1-phosphate adenylyltransferase [Candidatus Hydrogenedens sp.]HOK10446.1 D-glycero-beta-D-manno-heptose 1-phosphate adenylyltransferase [Candidatus Hydrogenedens sp.]HOL20102.1 D-glycero-beta-D-manno-heptose 1-phosphate adenylyltransferase [Candidatus Hydrogenedens sp.]HPP59900.1 D-glycero-beta-D-manno-heptose 1-phosphate adenylyltransferase [Candidatus Hydrogenedens sp.]
MEIKNYLHILSKFDKVRILAIGDIYLDENVYGKVTEVSLEAPIPVLEVLERRYNPGAAGNAGCNASALGATVYMVGVIGADSNAEILKKEFRQRQVNIDYLVVDPTRPTNTYGKLRAGGHNIPTQEVLRTDTPRPKPISGKVEEQIIKNIYKVAKKVDAIMVGDQVSSVITPKVIDVINECAKKYRLITVADSRARANIFKGFDVVLPNDKEAGIATGIEVTDYETLKKAGRALLKSARNAMITRGPEGITIFYEDGRIEDVPISPVQVIDVTGAGDTVTAMVTLTLVAGGSYRDSAVLGNTAAGVAVAQHGVVTVSREEVEQALKSMGGPFKLKTLQQLKKIVQQLKEQGKKVVWTNGCFDILHVGHITYLMRAKSEGDVLIVGLNSDRSVRQIKGQGRPVINEQNRALVLSALECVDYIILFDEKSPLSIIKQLRPDVYAKGGDYTLDTLVQPERRFVESYGGRIAIIPGVEGHSTTDIIHKVKNG